jgi:CRP-like cAMP-binding protein
MSDVSDVCDPATPLLAHRQCSVIRLQLKKNMLLAALAESAWDELSTLLAVEDRLRGEVLVRQGDRQLRQYFVLEGLLKRIVAGSDGRELTLRFTDAGDMETGQDAWRLDSSSPHAIVCVTKARVAHLPLKEWYEFIDRHPKARRVFEERVMRITSDMMTHAITLHLLDAPSRVQNFSYEHPELIERLPQKELASHLNLAAETLCRLVRHRKTAPSM